LRVRRGDIWLVSLDPTVANEQSGTRPGLVISSDRFNALPIRQAMIVPLTTRERGLPHHVPVRDDGGLSRTSWAMCEAARFVSLERFGKMISSASVATVTQVADQLTRWVADS